MSASIEFIRFIILEKGMDQKGDHGGDSEQETTSALFMYSKQTLTTHESTTFLKSHGLQQTKESDDFIHWRFINQIDFTPTLSKLMGISIPFGNLGFIIPELFTGDSSYGTNLLFHSIDNTRQLFIFVKDYTQKLSLADSELMLLLNEMDALLEKTSLIESEQVALIKQHFAVGQKVLETMRKKWAQFNMKFIFYGLIIVCLSTIFILLNEQSVTILFSFS